MGGLLHLFNFHHGHMRRKHKKQGHAHLEAPRNSLQLPTETLQDNYAPGGSEENLSKMSCYDSSGASMSKRSNDRQNAPSIVARLMGMDMLPLESKPEAPPLEDKKEISDEEVQNVKKSSSTPKKHFRSYKDAYFRYWRSASNSRKTVHPQEKELQKFKKDFEEWQTARFVECARVVELSNIPEHWLAQLDLTKEKMDRYETSRRALIEKSIRHKTDLSLKSRSVHEGDFHKRKESHSFSGRSLNIDIGQLSFKDSDMSSDKSSRIVVLKPGPDSFTTNDESWVSSNCSMEDRDCIEDLLEEVKQRLGSEMQEKTFRKGSTVRGGGIETPFKEKPVFVSRDTGEFLSERLKNILNVQDHQNIPDVSADITMITHFDVAKDGSETANDSLNAESRRKYWQDMNYETDLQGRSFRHEIGDDRIFQGPLSPRNLVRSLSAPISGTSFGKFLLEDRFVSSGAHIKRKHEALECLSPNFNERSYFREKVSNIKRSLSLRKMLFEKKFQSMDLSPKNEFDSNDIMNGQSFSEGNDNLSDVPPSPASICSSAHEELWKPADNLSPINSDVTSLGDQSVDNNVFRDISSNLTDLHKQLNELEYEGSELTTLSEDPSESDWEDEAEAYIKNLLITSGLYDGSWENPLSGWDPYMKPLDNWVFDEVEDSYRNHTIEEDDDMKWEHKLLFDLLNEALSVILGPPSTLCKFRKKTTEMTILPLPQGRMLLDRVWEVIREYACPSTDADTYSLDDLVAHEINIMPWANLMDDETRDLGKELGNLIIEELVIDIQKIDSAYID